MLRGIRYSFAKPATKQQISDVKRLYKQCFGEPLPPLEARILKRRASVPVGRLIHHLETFQPKRGKKDGT
jgi:hypothetical protein